MCQIQSLSLQSNILERALRKLVDLHLGALRVNETVICTYLYCHPVVVLVILH